MYRTYGDSLTRKCYIKFPWIGAKPTKALLKSMEQISLIDFNIQSSFGALALICSPLPFLECPGGEQNTVINGAKVGNSMGGAGFTYTSAATLHFAVEQGSLQMESCSGSGTCFLRNFVLLK